MQTDHVIAPGERFAGRLVIFCLKIAQNETDTPLFEHILQVFERAAQFSSPAFADIEQLADDAEDMRLALFSGA